MKTDREIQEELKEKNLTFRKLWETHTTIDERFKKLDKKSFLTFEEEQRQKDRRALMLRLKEEMNQIVREYRNERLET